MRNLRLRRRDLLRMAPGAGALTVGMLVCRPAGAFKLEELPATSNMARLYATRCGLPAEHHDIITVLRARLAEQRAAGGAADTEVAECPLCGCRVIVTADDERIEPLER